MVRDMKRVHALVVSSLLVVVSLAGFLPSARSGPPLAQEGTVLGRCRCKASWTAALYPHPSIQSASYSGDVEDGKCQRPLPSPCSQAELCHFDLSWTIQAKPGLTPYFDWVVDGGVHPGGNHSSYSDSYIDSLPCGYPKIVTVRADGERVLELYPSCLDCND